MFCDIDDIDTDLCWSSITCVIDTATEAPTTAPTASAPLDGTTGSDGGGTGGIDVGTELGPTAEPTVLHTSPHLGDSYDIELFAMVRSHFERFEFVAGAATNNSQNIARNGTPLPRRSRPTNARRTSGLDHRLAVEDSTLLH